MPRPPVPRSPTRPCAGRLSPTCRTLPFVAAGGEVPGPGGQVCGHQGVPGGGAACQEGGAAQQQEDQAEGDAGRAGRRRRAEGAVARRGGAAGLIGLDWMDAAGAGPSSAVLVPKLWVCAFHVCRKRTTSYDEKWSSCASGVRGKSGQRLPRRRLPGLRQRQRHRQRLGHLCIAMRRVPWWWMGSTGSRVLGPRPRPLRPKVPHSSSSSSSSSKEAMAAATAMAVATAQPRRWSLRTMMRPGKTRTRTTTLMNRP